MKFFYTFILVFILFSCKDKVSYEKPIDLIEKEQMIELLYDMHMAVGASNIKNVHLEKRRNYMSLVYEKYGVDSARFAASNLYYTSNIQEYEDIYEEVERRIDTIKKYHQAVMDSITGEQTLQRNQAIEKNKDSLSKTRIIRN